MPTIEALERQLRQPSAGWEPWLVYADWLTERGDVRGQMIALAHRLAEGALGPDEAGETQRLHLERCGIGDSGISALARSEAFGALTHLRVLFDEVGNAGARAVAESAVLGSLIELGLHGNQVGTAGARYLARSAALGALQHLRDDQQ